MSKRGIVTELENHRLADVLGGLYGQMLFLTYESTVHFVRICFVVFLRTADAEAYFEAIGV